MNQFESWYQENLGIVNFSSKYYISREAWDAAIDAAIKEIKSNVSTSVDLGSLTAEHIREKVESLYSGKR